MAFKLILLDTDKLPMRSVMGLVHDAADLVAEPMGHFDSGRPKNWAIEKSRDGGTLVGNTNLVASKIEDILMKQYAADRGLVSVDTMKIGDQFRDAFSGDTYVVISTDYRDNPKPTHAVALSGPEQGRAITLRPGILVRPVTPPTTTTSDAPPVVPLTPAPTPTVRFGEISVGRCFRHVAAASPTHYMRVRPYECGPYTHKVGNAVCLTHPNRGRMYSFLDVADVEPLPADETV